MKQRDIHRLALKGCKNGLYVLLGSWLAFLLLWELPIRLAALYQNRVVFLKSPTLASSLLALLYPTLALVILALLLYGTYLIKGLSLRTIDAEGRSLETERGDETKLLLTSLLSRDRWFRARVTSDLIPPILKPYLQRGGNIYLCENTRDVDALLQQLQVKDSGSFTPPKIPFLRTDRVWNFVTISSSSFSVFVICFILNTYLLDITNFRPLHLIQIPILVILASTSIFQLAEPLNNFKRSWVSFEWGIWGETGAGESIVSTLNLSERWGEEVSIVDILLSSLLRLNVKRYTTKREGLVVKISRDSINLLRLEGENLVEVN